MQRFRIHDGVRNKRLPLVRTIYLKHPIHSKTAIDYFFALCDVAQALIAAYTQNRSISTIVKNQMDLDGSDEILLTDNHRRRHCISLLGKLEHKARKILLQILGRCEAVYMDYPTVYLCKRNAAPYAVDSAGKMVCTASMMGCLTGNIC